MQSNLNPEDLRLSVTLLKTRGQRWQLDGDSVRLTNIYQPIPRCFDPARLYHLIRLGSTSKVRATRAHVRTGPPAGDSPARATLAADVTITASERGLVGPELAAERSKLPVAQ